MADNPFKPKPLVDINLVSEFGGIEDEAQFRAEGVAQHDYSYVPGFSDMRERRDLKLGEFARGEIKGKEVPVLPVNLRWFRTVKGTGSDPDGMRVAHAKNLRYRAVTQNDKGQPWMTDIPPGGNVAADGTIRSAGGDLQLFVIDQDGAARNALRKKILTEDMVDGMKFAEGGLLKAGKAVKGAEPSITVISGGGK